MIDSTIRVYATRQLGAAVLAAGLALPLISWNRSDARPLPAPSATVSGQAKVIDGDTIDIDGVRIRLDGIDAPEATQTCGRRWIGSWSCGEAAASELAKLVTAQPVTCESRGTDKYGRMLGSCFAGGLDINAEMVKPRPRLGIREILDRLPDGRSRRPSPQSRHLAGRGTTAVGIQASALGNGRGYSARRLRHQGQRHRQRPHLSHAVEPLVRPDPSEPGQGQALVLLRSGGRRGRLAAGPDPLSTAGIYLRQSRSFSALWLMLRLASLHGRHGA